MRIFACITTQHDLRLVALAAVLCLFGSWITIRLYMRSRDDASGSPVAWLFLGAVMAGSTIWCTHFIAMLAYRPGVPMSFEPVLTGVSLAVAVVTAGAALAVARAPFRHAVDIGGVLFGTGITAMHYTGMAAFATYGLIDWNTSYIVSSVVFSTVLSVCAFRCATSISNGITRQAVSTAFLVLAIVLLHFTGMTAITITPFAPSADMLTGEDAHATLAVAVAGVGLLVLGTGLASYLLDRQSDGRSRARLRHLAESTVDGVVIEQEGRIVEVNAAFVALLGTKRELLLGSTLASFLPDFDKIEEGSLIQTRIAGPHGIDIPVEIHTHQETRDRHAPGNLVCSVRDLRPRIEQERRIAHLAMNDSLTGLPNRMSFLERLDRMIAGGGDDMTFALLAADLNRFKEVNDLHGHAAGDHVLRAMADRMRAAMREGEFFARLGGDEFVAMKSPCDKNSALEFAGRLEAFMFEPVRFDHSDVVCGASIGIALYPRDGLTSNALMNNADLAMYRAKGSVTQNVCFYEVEMDELVRQRRKVLLELREAISKGQFEVHYQLQASLSTREVTAYEALARWKHPTRGYIEPSHFIPLAEESGLIVPLGEWVLRTACTTAAGWKVPHKIAVNLSAVQLANLDLPRLVHSVLIDTGLPPRRLELEITETSMIQDPERTIHILRQIKAMGVSIAMDDFGVGHSSLSTLRAFPFDKIKLDKSFMVELDHSPQARAIIRAVLTLGDSLGIPVLAEGVETEAQLAFLREQGCDEVQGFLLGRPSGDIDQQAEPPARHLLTDEELQRRKLA